MITIKISIKNWLLGILAKDDYIWNLRRCDCEYNKAFRIVAYFDNKNCGFLERSFDKIISPGNDEVSKAKKTR